jgi:hypothetical protein
MKVCHPGLRGWGRTPSSQRSADPAQSTVPSPTTNCGYPHNKSWVPPQQIVGTPTTNCGYPHNESWVPPQQIVGTPTTNRGYPHNKSWVPPQQIVGTPTTNRGYSHNESWGYPRNRLSPPLNDVWVPPTLNCFRERARGSMAPRFREFSQTFRMCLAGFCVLLH